MRERCRCLKLGLTGDHRNAFIFNLCFVFERDAELASFEPLVRKTARTLRAMEVSPHHTSSLT